MARVPAWDAAIVVIGTSAALGQIVSEIRTVFGLSAVCQYDRPHEATIPESAGVILIDEQSLARPDDLSAGEIPILLVRSEESGSSIPPTVTDVLSPSAPTGEIEARLQTVMAMSSYRQTLLARTVSKLELEIRADPPLAQLARSIGHPLWILAVVPSTDTATTIYVTSEQAPASGVPDLPDLSVRLVSAGEPAVYSVQSGESVLLEVAADYAGRVRSVEWAAGRCRITVEQANSARIRPFVDAIDSSIGATEIRSHRHVECRPDEHWLVPLPMQELTLQERRTLETAYAGGYFNWPREQTGEEIAASMGIAQSTFARHLRRALQIVLQVVIPQGKPPRD